MARRSDHTQEELKELIIKASIKLITEIGPSAFGTRAIAKEIGYSFGTIYHIYDNLETLRYHVKGRILDSWHAALAEGMSKEKEKAKYLVNAYIDISVEQRFLWAFMFALPSDPTENSPDWYVEKVENLFSLVNTAFVPITQDKKKANSAARAIWTSIHGICVLSMSHKLDMVSDESPKQMANHILDIYLAGLRCLEECPELATPVQADEA